MRDYQQTAIIHSPPEANYILTEQYKHTKHHKHPEAVGGVVMKDGAWFPEGNQFSDSQEELRVRMAEEHAQLLIKPLAVINVQICFLG